MPLPLPDLWQPFYYYSQPGFVMHVYNVSIQEIGARRSMGIWDLDYILRLLLKSKHAPHAILSFVSSPLSADDYAERILVIKLPLLLIHTACPLLSSRLTSSVYFALYPIALVTYWYITNSLRIQRIKTILNTVLTISMGWEFRISLAEPSWVGSFLWFWSIHPEQQFSDLDKNLMQRVRA